MSFNGSGTFLINTTGQPVVSGTVISSTAFNALTADLATGLSTCLTKDGQTTPTANIPMGSNKITGLAVGTDATDAPTLSQVQSTVTKLIGSVSGTDTITGSLTPSLAAYAAGQMFYFVAAGDNTGAVTLNVNSLGAKSITKVGTTALVAGDIKSGQTVAVIYDGTRFQMVNPADASVVSGPSSATDNAVARFDGTTGKLIQNSTGVTITDGNVLTTTANASINGLSVGKGAGSGADNTAIGVTAGDSMTTGYSNTVVGNGSGTAITTGYRNTFVGDLSAYFVSTGNSNVAVGYLAGDGMASNRTNNTALGTFAFYNGGAWDNSTCLGYSADVTGGNQVQLGNSGTTTYAYGAVQDRSDVRDKTDIQDTDLGLSFVMALRPRKFKWDMREDYRTQKPENATPEQLAAWQEANKLANLTHDGTYARSRFHQGLIAQEVKQTMDAMGIDFGGYQDHTVKGGDDVQSIGYNELIAPLIKAIQELKTEFDAYKATHP